MFAALLLLVTPYADLPKPSNREIVQCKYAFDDLEAYVAVINRMIWNHDVDRGGRLTWNQGNDIRFEVRSAARPYIERIRYIGWEGRSSECKQLSEAGQQAAYAVAKKYFR